MTTPNALAAIREAREKIGERALIGVGTVLDGNICRAAIAAGAVWLRVEGREVGTQGPGGRMNLAFWL